MKKLFISLLALSSYSSFAQKAMNEMWDKTASSSKQNSRVQWFRDAKFGLFLHWGLYADLAGTWDGKRYYGSGEWIMAQGKVPAADYAKVAGRFNPTNFNAEEWVGIAKDAGIRYIVITAKHHEGFAMFDSKVSDFNIVKATPYKKDPMKALAEATRKQGMPFGFYYSQFLDWHEPNGGGNNWDFDESKKDYLKYYHEKSIPQLKELMTNYGKLGIVWFDMPGGLTKEQTQKLVDSLHKLQPECLFSSRVGQGLGDYRDFGDSEVPPVPIDDVWESIYTHNDSWGYIQHDMNFKSSKEIIQLLANVASKGGNLMLNVGPDGTGNLPYYSVKFLKQTGAWLKQNGESIYGTTFGFVPAQPWGVTTGKQDKLYLHVLNVPHDNILLVPSFGSKVSRVYSLINKKVLSYKQDEKGLHVALAGLDPKSPDNVFVVEYLGGQQPYDATAPVTISSQFDYCNVDAVFGKTAGNAKTKSVTFSHYFGDWKHATCITDMQQPQDSVSFNLRIVEKGDYKILLEYACPQSSAKQEGVVNVNGNDYYFRTLRTSEYDASAPLMFIKHPVATITIDKPGTYTMKVHPTQQGTELFKLKTVIFEPM